jgi:hypothetical protein
MMEGSRCFRVERCEEDIIDVADSVNCVALDAPYGDGACEDVVGNRQVQMKIPNLSRTSRP